MPCTSCDKLFILLFACLLFACQEQDKHVVAWVNDYPISDTEFKHWAVQERAEVYNYFYTQHGVRDNENFWEQTYQGESPLFMLQKRALETAVRWKVQQILALEKGLVLHINFNQLLKEMQEKNIANEEKIKRGEVIYGLRKYTAKSYVAHVHDQMVIELKRELGKAELKATTNELSVLKNSEASNLRHRHVFFQQQFVDENYPAFIDQLVSAAKVEINEKQLKTIKTYLN